MRERENEREKDPPTGGGAGPREPERAGKGERKRATRRGRGGPLYDKELEDLAQTVGRNKLGADSTTEERHYSRSLKIRRLVLEFLVQNVGTSWASLPELNARAANYAGCSSVTAARWIFQFTRAEARFKLVEGIYFWILDAREKAATL